MLKTTLILFILLGGIDFLWLGVFAKDHYAKELGGLFKKDVSIISAVLVYLILAFGIYYFVFRSNPASLGTVLINSAIFGAIVYGTYELTNLAVIRGWSLKLVFTDIVWGIILSGLSASITFYVLKNFL